MKRSTLQFWKASKVRRTMNMGIGLLGGRKLKCPRCDEEFNECSIVFKRKFRWTIEGETPSGKLEAMFVKVATRPQPEIEETEINFLSAKTWIPGKQHDWQEMTVSAFDMGNDTHKNLFEVIQSIMHNPEQGECPPEKLAKLFTLNLYDGCGGLIESWDLFDVYLSKVNFGELDYSSSECVDMEMTLRYKKVVYRNALKDGGPMNLPPSLSMGYYGNHKVTCPKCKHEFQSGSNIIF